MINLYNILYQIIKIFILIDSLFFISSSYGSLLQRKDYYLNECLPNESLFIREIQAISNQKNKNLSPLLLVHGARVGGVGSFDLPVKGGSLAEEIANKGIDVYILDLRGYGYSSRPAEMSLPPERSSPIVRTSSAVEDISCAINHIQKLIFPKKINILGWATGGHWAAAYATSHPKNINKIIIYNSLYGVNIYHPLLGIGSFLDNPQRSGSLNPTIGGYQFNTRESLFSMWDKSIPIDDKNLWRDPIVAKAYADEALASDPESYIYNPPKFRSPNGAMADSFKLALGNRQWQAKDLTMPTLVIFSQNDFWSRLEDAKAIVDEAPNAKLAIIPNGTHFAHLDRDKYGRSFFINVVINFLYSNSDEKPWSDQ